MATQVLVPLLGESITEATLLNWLKGEGDPVQRGEAIAELETAKATLTLESPVNGILLKKLVPEGTLLTIGQLVATIGKPGEEWQPEDEQPSSTEPAPAPPVQPPVVEATKVSRAISPAARRRAAELGVTLEELASISSGKRITSEDVERYAAIRVQAKSAETLPFQRVELSDHRRTIARRLGAAQQIPQFSVSMEIHADPFLQVLHELRSKVGNLTVTVMLMYVVAQVLQKHPYLNAHFADDAILQFETIDFSLAIATPRGLISPTVPSAEKMSLPQLATYTKALVQRARTGTLLPNDMRDGTFTISNLGMYGVTQFVPILNPPQVAIMGIGAIQPRWIALPDSGGKPVQLLNLTITADHRAVDGDQVARFLEDLSATMRTVQPNQILL